MLSQIPSLSDNSLQVDEQLKVPRQRSVRCTGAALAVAVGLLENSTAGSGAQILLFTSGPATLGPGQVVGRDQAEALRSHKVSLPPVLNASLFEAAPAGFEQACGQFVRVVRRVTSTDPYDATFKDCSSVFLLKHSKRCAA